jgi:3-phosphoshikimate 1-carboxyvinyltransferase
MIVKVPSNIDIKKIQAPASKSYAQRAIFAATLGQSKCLVKNLGTCDDVNHILAISEQLGAEILKTEDGIEINPRINEISRNLNCGESGLGIRLTTSIVTTFGGQFTIRGEGSLVSRPMNSFETFLPQLGVKFESNNGFVPLTTNGIINGGNIQIDGSMSSQFLSGLLMAIPLAEQDSQIEVSNLVSFRYVDMTLQVMKDFGIQFTSENNKNYQIRGNQTYKNPKVYEVEADWSGAAFWIIYGALYQDIEIQGLNEHSLQADRAILEVLDKCGTSYTWNQKNLRVQQSSLKPFEFDATNCPDLFPILATLAAAINGESKIRGVHRLKDKESDRGLSIQSEFAKLGLQIELEKDTMIIKGHSSLNSGTVHSNNDHRIAMAFAIASNLTKHGIEIENAEAVAKSYPGFWSIIEKS